MKQIDALTAALETSGFKPKQWKGITGYLGEPPCDDWKDVIL